MSLNDILELCEKHMSEGDYLKASTILKNAHDKAEILPDGHRQYIIDIKISNNVNEDNPFDSRILARKIITDRYANIQKIEMKFDYEPESEYRWMTFCKFSDFLSIWIRMNFSHEILLMIDDDVYTMEFDKYYNMKKKMFQIETGEDADEFCPETEFLVRDFSNYCSERIKELLKYSIRHLHR